MVAVSLFDSSRISRPRWESSNCDCTNDFNWASIDAFSKYIFWRVLDNFVLRSSGCFKLLLNKSETFQYNILILYIINISVKSMNIIICYKFWKF